MHQRTPRSILRNSAQQFPEVFSTNKEDIGRTDLITMDIYTGDSLSSAKKPYTLPLISGVLGY